MSGPIEQARNIGPLVGAELRSIGISTCEALAELGWQEAWHRLCRAYPERNHLMCGYALAGAEFDLDCLRLPAQLKAEVRASKPRRGPHR